MLSFHHCSTAWYILAWTTMTGWVMALYSINDMMMRANACNSSILHSMDRRWIDGQCGCVVALVRLERNVEPTLVHSLHTATLARSLVLLLLLFSTLSSHCHCHRHRRLSGRAVQMKRHGPLHTTMSCHVHWYESMARQAWMGVQHSRSY